MLSDPNLQLNLIILDLNLPRITGLGVLERYQVKDIPVVVFSASWRQTDEHLALALGAREYIHKPTDLQNFTDTVSGMILKWVARGESGAAVSS